MIIIPDVHGRSFWKDAVKGREDEKIIFLGDYTDPYPWELISKEECLESLKDIIGFKLEHYKNVILLIGNHDLSYIDDRMPKCRHDFKNHNEIHNIFMENIDLFNLAYEEDINGKKFIFSHSGIMPQWIRYCEEEDKSNNKISMDNIVDYLNNEFQNNLEHIIPWLNHISKLRGGYDIIGSCVWSDVYELMGYLENLDSDNEQIPNSYQIVGHTQLKSDPIIKDEFACLDCRKGFELNNNGEIEIIKNV